MSIFGIRVFRQPIAGGAAVLAVTQFGASLAGLVRDRVLAQTFPPGVDSLDVVSVYIAAFRPSDFLFQTFIMSALSVALVPLLSSHLAHGREEEVQRLTSSVLLVGNLVFGALALALALSLPYLVPFLVQFQGESLQLYISFARLACLTNFLFVTGNVFGHVLIAKQTYLMYGLTPILYTVGTILGTVFIPGPYGPMIGTIAGAVVYVVLRFQAVLKTGWSLTAHCSPLTAAIVHPDLRDMGLLMIPRILALGAVQLQLLLFDTMASGLGLGAVTVNAYARNFQSVAVGVIGIALAQSVFSPLSQAHARGERDRYSVLLKKGGGLALIGSVAASLGLILLAPVAGWLVKLTSTPVFPLFIFAITVYAFSVPFESLNHLLLRAFYARKDSLTPALTSLLNAAVAVVVAAALLPKFGVAGIGVGFGVGQLLQAMLLWLKLKVRF